MGYDWSIPPPPNSWLFSYILLLLNLCWRRMLHIAVAIIPFALWIPPTRCLTDICIAISRCYSHSMFFLHTFLLQNTHIDITRTPLSRVPFILRDRLQHLYNNQDESRVLMQELSLQQLSMLMLWLQWKKDINFTWRCWNAIRPSSNMTVGSKKRCVYGLELSMEVSNLHH